MTTTDSSFVANGIPTGVGRRVGIGFYANAKSSLPSAVSRPFTFGTLAVGTSAGLYGAIDDIAIPTPGGATYDEAGVGGHIQ